MRAVTRPLSVCCLLLVAVGLAANTRFGFGTIVKVDLTGEDSRRNRPSFVVRFEFRNLSSTQVLPTLTFPVEERTRHGWRVYFLDGEPSTAEEALRVGRAVCMSDNDMVCHVSTTSGPAPLGAEAEPADALWRVQLRNAFAADLAKVRKGKVGEFEVRRSGVELLVACRGGEVHAAVAVVSMLGGRTDYVLDPAGIAVADGALRGRIAFDAVFPEGDARYRPREEGPIPVSCSFEAHLADDGSLEGKYTGTCGGSERADSLGGGLVPAVATPDPARLWLQIDALTGHKFVYAVLEMTGGAAQPDGRVLYSKGHRIGAVAEQDLTLAEGRLRGSLACSVSQHGGERRYDLEIDAALYGGRLLFGTYTVAGEDGPVTRALRGGLTDAAGPQIEGCNREQKERVRALQSELHPPEEKQDP